MLDKFNYDYSECRACINYDTLSGICQIAYCYVRETRIEVLREQTRQFHVRLKRAYIVLDRLTEENRILVVQNRGLFKENIAGKDL
jgi:hypothetical protein